MIGQGSFDNPAVRQAVQTAVGVSAAIAAGSAISGQRWYWAVIATFVVALGVGSRTEAVVKAMQRVVGTIAGVVGGIAMAAVVDGHPFVAMGVALICVFFAYYAFQAAYGTMMFFITVMLSVLYGLLGQFKPQLMVVRLEETAAGAAIGVAAVFLILPTRQDHAFAAALSAYLESLARVLSLPRGTVDAQAAVADLQAKTRELRGAHGAVKRGWAGLASPSYRDALRAAMRCTYLAREWMMSPDPFDPSEKIKPLAERGLARIADLKGEPVGSGRRARRMTPGTSVDKPSVELLTALVDSVDRLPRLEESR